MSTITTKDGTEIYYKDQGAGAPVVFSHGWPLNSDAWESQMAFLSSRGYLEKLDVPTLIIHHEGAPILSTGAVALRSSNLVKNATLKIYKGAPHGLASTPEDRLNTDLLAFLKGSSEEFISATG